MNDVFFARSQMGMSLAFHIIFAVIGMAMPLLMAVSEGCYLWTKKPIYLELSKRWAAGTAILFAVGAVSGTVLSFELGLLFPKFMQYAGGLIGMPFSLEGFAFFTEAIFLGIYLYGWNRVSPVLHWLAGIVVAVSGILSAVFVVLANSWMNAPTGFDIVNGQPTNINPVAAMLNPASLHETIHMVLAAYVATAFLVAGVHAFFLLRDPNSVFHRASCSIALVVACVSIPLQMLSGDFAAREVAKLEPPKLAAMEAHYQTGTGVPLVIGGIPNDVTGKVNYALQIPFGLSLLVGYNPATKVVGLEDFPRDQWPNVSLVHLSFDIMVGTGSVMLAVAVWVIWVWWRTRRLPDNKWLLRALVCCSPFGFIAVETGWFVTELGRQPWIIYDIMRTKEAVTPMPGLVVPFTTFTIIYLLLAVIVTFLLRRQFIATYPRIKEETSITTYH
ncbi:MAG TPA: cytochrome ubiquinol oxidase subunit I [Chthoniobacterales bacterium]|nr:cytochrome ubiquinol oxidase subunit I [Chthoniobacterales bacterium]